MSQTMKIDAAFDAARPRDNYPIVVRREFLARPGHAYRIKARMRATHPEAKVNRPIGRNFAAASMMRSRGCGSRTMRRNSLCPSTASNLDPVEPRADEEARRSA
jgi:hypothetical protein